MEQEQQICNLYFDNMNEMYSFNFEQEVVPV